MKVPMFEMVIWYTEWCPFFLAGCLVLSCYMKKKSSRIWFIPAVSLPIGALCFGALALIESTEFARAGGFDMTGPTLREALEAYIKDGTGDLHHIIEGGQYPPIFALSDFRRFVTQHLPGSYFHSTSQDASTLPEAYNKGDDWFEATLGEPMVYTGAIYTGPNETMWSAQLNKLEFIAHALGVKPGDKAMDVGCGWGRLVNHMASKGADVTGVLMADDQRQYSERMTKHLGNEKKAKILLQNFFDIEFPPKTFNVISSVEMAEHVGIRNYNKFLLKVHELLADDGTFYLQVAGLRRGYGKGYNAYEDLVWGMFMEEHIFPGADASCPLGWVVTQLEKAGFEVQNVYNMGYHYSETITHWLQLWESKKDAIVKGYGERAYRRWQVFLKWSVRASRRGGSTVNFITATKSSGESARKAAQKRLAPGVFKLPPRQEKVPKGKVPAARASVGVPPSSDAKPEL